MNELLFVCSTVDTIVTIMAKMAFIFMAYKSIHAMNVYINRSCK